MRITTESATVSLHSTGSSNRLDRAVQKKLNACYGLTDRLRAISFTPTRHQNYARSCRAHRHPQALASVVLVHQCYYYLIRICTCRPKALWDTNDLWRCLVEEQFAVENRQSNAHEVCPILQSYMESYARLRRHTLDITFSVFALSNSLKTRLTLTGKQLLQLTYGNERLNLEGYRRRRGT